ncbi:hypothetical protein IJ384_05525 [bacterium]|nr:hypothetical protein [bacterium]
MSDENKIEKVEVKHECFCQSKWFRKFLTVALGTFVGVFCALSLFSALNKPQMPPCPFAKGPMMRPAMHCCHYHSHHYKPRGDFYHKKVMKDRISPDKVKIEIKD